MKVAVEYEENVPPVADAGKDREALTGETVAFDASDSSDPGGAIVAYEWDFGDGHRSTGVAPHHVYQFPGTYQVSLKVRDGHMTSPAEASDTVEVSVRDPDNEPPAAVAGSDLEVAAGEVIRFDGTASSDPDGNVISYEWDFGTGETSRMARPEYTYHEPGTYAVTLRVLDDNPTDPKSAEDRLTVTVRAAKDGAATNE